MKMIIRNTIQLIGISLVGFLVLFLFLFSVQGESNVVMSVDDVNEFQIIDNGTFVIQEIKIENGIILKSSDEKEKVKYLVEPE